MSVNQTFDRLQAALFECVRREYQDEVYRAQPGPYNTYATYLQQSMQQIMDAVDYGDLAECAIIKRWSVMGRDNHRYPTWVPNMDQ